MLNFSTKLARALNSLIEDEHQQPKDSKAKNNTTKRQPTVAVDLDGTLTVKANFQGADVFAAPRPGAKEALAEFRRLGFMIIIFTVRGNTEAIAQWLDENEMTYDWINENPNQPADSSGKIIADVYIDDRAIDATIDWPEITKLVKKRLLPKRRTEQRAA